MGKGLDGEISIGQTFRHLETFELREVKKWSERERIPIRSTKLMLSVRLTIKFGLFIHVSEFNAQYANSS